MDFGALRITWVKVYLKEREHEYDTCLYQTDNATPFFFFISLLSKPNCHYTGRSNDIGGGIGVGHAKSQSHIIVFLFCFCFFLFVSFNRREDIGSREID